MQPITLTNWLLTASLATTLALSACDDSGGVIGQKFVPKDESPTESASDSAPAAEPDPAAAESSAAATPAPPAKPAPAQESAAASRPGARPAPGATGSTPMQSQCATCGTIESISARAVKGEGSGLGAAAGAVLGGIIGHQFGSGSGNKAATVAGAVGGAVAGNEIEKRNRASEVYDYTIVMSDGTRTTISQPNSSDFYVGDKVQIVDGQMYKI